jgi:hypothetical protein
VPIGRLLVSPTPEETGLAAFLAANLSVAVEEVNLADKLDVKGSLDVPAQWQLFHLVGASLRVESRAL